MIQEFKYSIKSKKSGKLIAQEIVAFGDENNPFPGDWKDNPVAQMALQDYKDMMVKKYLDITFEEGSELDET